MPRKKASGETSPPAAGPGVGPGNEAVEKLPAAWCVYVLRCGDGTLYCGITNDLPRRLGRHESGTGARYTRGRAPLVLARSWEVSGKSMALKAERRFKRFRRARKERLLTDASCDWLAEVSQAGATTA